MTSFMSSFTDCCSYTILKHFRNVTLILRCHFTLPEPKAHKLSLYYRIAPASVPCVHSFEYEYSLHQQAKEFYLKHRLKLGKCGEKVVLGFGANWFRALVSMATESSIRVILGKWCLYFVFFYIPPL